MVDSGECLEHSVWCPYVVYQDDLDPTLDSPEQILERRRQQTNGVTMKKLSMILVSVLLVLCSS